MLNHLQDKLSEHDFLCLTPKVLELLILKYFASTDNS